MFYALFWFLFYYSSFVVFILNNLNNSTIISGAITNPINSKTFCVGKCGILNTSLRNGTPKIININAADAITARINFLLPAIPVLNIETLLFLTLNTCTSSESAKSYKCHCLTHFYF